MTNMLSRVQPIDARVLKKPDSHQERYKCGPSGADGDPRELFGELNVCSECDAKPTHPL